MSRELPPKIEANLEQLAKWSARQDDNFESAGNIAYMLGKAAEIRRDGTPAQRSQALTAIARMRQDSRPFAQALKAFVAELDRISGHEGIFMKPKGEATE